MQWIEQNHDLITALTGAGTLLVWVIYLQVFVSSYRRQLRATLLITRGAGEDLEGRCFVSNMSSGPVYVQSVIVTLDTPDATLICPVTDVLELEGDGVPNDPRLRTRQGPLSTGEIRDIGTFGSLVRHVLKTQTGGSVASRAEQAAVTAVTIEVLGIYGQEDLPIGARRRFVLHDEEGRIHIEGEDIATKQIRGRRERRRLVSDLQRDT
ncbi:hypothetical protein [Chelativorans sp. AA-79]|uniref:hypothetical protein n=1 Tax=Chelativorans sp. AA-79 TaxID=3028735 RepID=UPI0023F84F4B|nr:hypothetical protein [Chelativorans sp. AA-79]WEX10554.1 hypothetical protein PVE73_06240 [Chelativorans sp. AA-79]